MAITAGHFYWSGSDTSQLLLCTDAVGFEFQQLPSGFQQKYAADPTAQFTDLQTVGMTPGGIAGAPGPFPHGTVDGASYEIVEVYGTAGGFANAKCAMLRPLGTSAIEKDAYICVPVENIANTNPANLFVPFVSSVTPAGGPAAGNTPVVIKGSGFKNASAVHFGATAQPVFVVVSDEEIHCEAPAHVAGAIAVTVTTPGGTSSNALNSAVYTYA